MKAKYRIVKVKDDSHLMDGIYVMKGWCLFWYFHVWFLGVGYWGHINLVNPFRFASIEQAEERIFYWKSRKREIKTLKNL